MERMQAKTCAVNGAASAQAVGLPRRRMIEGDGIERMASGRGGRQSLLENRGHGASGRHAFGRLMGLAILGADPRARAAADA